MAENTANSPKTVGNMDPTVSEHLKTWIMQDNICVCGVTGEGTTKEIAVNWDSPFEGEDVGSRASTTSSIAQVFTETTSVTTLNTRQVWKGNRPTSFSLVMVFYALADPIQEVMYPLQTLEEMASPMLNEYSPVSMSGNATGGKQWSMFGASLSVGRVPNLVSVCIGRKAIYPECVIESISQPLDAEVSRDGYLLRCTVQMQVSTVQVENKDVIKNYYRL